MSVMPGKLENNIEHFLSVVEYIRFLDSKNDSHSTAVEYYDNRISRSEYWKYIDKYRSYFHKLGIAKEEPVAICMLNSPEYEFVLLSLMGNGSVASTVSKSFLNADLDKQTTERNIKTLILSIEFLPELIEQKTFEQLTEKSSLCRLIFTDSSDYSASCGKEDYSDLIARAHMPESIEIIYPGEMAKSAKKMTPFPPEKESHLNRIATYSNTGGTTGAPKCACHTHRAIISLIASHDKTVYKEFDLREHSRSLLVIPISHITCQFYALLVRRAYGATIIYNPGVFEPEVLCDVLAKKRIDDVILPFGLYYAIFQNKYGLGELNLNTPCCGGEPTPYLPTKYVNERLQKAGCSRIIIGTGSTEFGSGIMASYGMENRTNESGYFFPFAEGFLLNPKDRSKIIENNKRGVLFANAPWQMSGYLDDQRATDDFFWYEENGKRYGTNNDIAEIVGTHNGKAVYSMLGRTSDFVLPDGDGTYRLGVSIENGEIEPVDFEKGYFLFDMRDILLNIKGIVEVQTVILPNDINGSSGYPVANVTLANGADAKSILKQIYGEFYNKTDFIPAGIIFRTHFERSLSSDKREVISLIDERTNYYFVSDEGTVLSVHFPIGRNPEYSLTTDKIKIVTPPTPRRVYSFSCEQND